MDKIIIEGGHRLKGTVKISGSKNAALPLMAATLLTDEPLKLRNVPQLQDVNMMARILESLGVSVRTGHSRLTLNAKTIRKAEADYDLVRKMRASFLVIGPLLARLGHAKVSLPGGCAIGARPIDLHLSALQKMGAKISLKAGYVLAQCKRLKGAEILFEKVTVGGTENILMAATLASGTTVIRNAAQEPEIINLAETLVRMGAKIDGAGTQTITIQGVDSLKGCEVSVIPDRVEAGTFMIASALTRGDVWLHNVIPEHLTALTEKLLQTGAFVEIKNGKIHVKGKNTIRPVDLTTAPYPGFATDLQAQFMALLCHAKGSSVIQETIFENRYMHVLELMRMGAHIKADGAHAFVTGVKRLQGAPVMATDLRASACLLLAGLAGQGITEIHRVYHIDRGYVNIEKKMRSLGAKVKRARVKY